MDWGTFFVSSGLLVLIIIAVWWMLPPIDWEAVGKAYADLDKQTDY